MPGTVLKWRFIENPHPNNITDSLKALTDAALGTKRAHVQQALPLLSPGPRRRSFSASPAHFINDRVLQAWGSITQSLKLPLAQPTARLLSSTPGHLHLPLSDRNFTACSSSSSWYSPEPALPVVRLSSAEGNDFQGSARNPRSPEPAPPLLSCI